MVCESETLFERDALIDRMECEIRQFTDGVDNTFPLVDAMRIYYDMFNGKKLDYHKIIVIEPNIERKRQLWISRIRILFAILWLTESKPFAKS